MEHKIVITCEQRGLWSLPVKKQIRTCIRAALRMERIAAPCEINVFICGDETIRVLNRENRQIDRATDVLSFPMFDLTPGQPPEDWTEYRDPGTGLVPLGDMAISYERACAQAKEFGHSAAREVGYLTIHSVLHLLGYDHMDEGAMKRQMRAREEAILAEVALPRD